MNKIFPLLCSAVSEGEQQLKALPERSSRSIFFLILVLAVIWVFSATGCGKKGPPVPPVDKREPVKEQSLLHPYGDAALDKFAWEASGAREKYWI